MSKFKTYATCYIIIGLIVFSVRLHYEYPNCLNSKHQSSSIEDRKDNCFTEEFINSFISAYSWPIYLLAKAAISF